MLLEISCSNWMITSIVLIPHLRAPVSRYNLANEQVLLGYPTSVLKSDLELLRGRIGSSLGSSVERIPPTYFAYNLCSSPDDKADRIARSDRRRRRHNKTRSSVPEGA